jgi:hypothetical protein
MITVAAMKTRFIGKAVIFTALVCALTTAFVGCENVLAAEAAALQAKTVSPVINLTDASSKQVSMNGTIVFADTAAGNSRDLVITATNSGKTDLAIGDITLTMGSGTEAGSFILVSQPSKAISAGANATLALRFLPSSLGDKSATVTIPTNDVSAPSFVFIIKGSCVAGNKDITAFGLVSPAVVGIISGTTITVYVPIGTDRTLLVPSFSTTGVSVTANDIAQISGTTPVDFSKGAVNYIVKAADGTTKSYAVTVDLVALPPTPTTSAVSSITPTTAVCGGIISSDGGASVTARGVCWSTSPDPTTSDSVAKDPGVGSGSYTSQLTGLAPGTPVYYVRAFATNVTGTAYGLPVTFPTPATTPTVTTAVFSAITDNSATGGGTVTADGGAAVTERGLCYSDTISTPTIGNTRITGGSGTGGFSGSFSGLATGKQYYVRAYATNTIGTAYGDVAILTTLTAAPTTVVPSAINATSATSGANFTADNGAPIISRGICWCTTTGPTVTTTNTAMAGTCTITATGTGLDLSASLSGLNYATTYYVRAYITNAGGTVYGDEKSLMTVGYPGPSGGYVFYDAGSTQIDAGYGNWRYMEAARVDQGQSVWGDDTDTRIGGVIITKTELGAGPADTDYLKSFLTTGTAAKVCYNLVLDGYSDWFLPSKDELNLMMVNLRPSSLGGFQPFYYWSSSEYNYTAAFNQWDIAGSVAPKTNATRFIRAVRRY